MARAGGGETRFGVYLLAKGFSTQSARRLMLTVESKHKRANETVDTSSPFYGWELRKENVDAYVTLGFEGLTIFLYPKFEGYDHMDTLCHQLGESMYLATVEDVGGKPSYSEFVKVIEYLLSPIRDKVGRVHDSDVKAYCSGGSGWRAARRCWRCCARPAWPARFCSMPGSTTPGWRIHPSTCLTPMKRSAFPWMPACSFARPLDGNPARSTAA